MMVCRRSFILAIVGVALCSTGLTIAAPAGLDRTEIADLFSQGKQFFHEANEAAPSDPEKARQLYRKAAMRFERIAEEGGIVNGKLYYNIANTYFRMQDLGRAILYYRRALRLMPNDPNLQQNLTYARSKCADKVLEKPQVKVMQTLFFWHYDLSMRTRTVLFLIFFSAVWVLAAVRVFVKPAGTRGLLLATVVLAVVFLGSLVVEEWVNSRTSPGVILAGEVVARKGDSETYQPSFSEPLHAGTEFDLLENRGEWYRVELADGRPCWIPAKSAALVK